MPQSNTDSIYNSRIFSTDETIRKNLLLQSENFDFSLNQLSPEDIIFSQTKSHESLKGNYIFLVNLYGVNSENQILESRIILGGKAFGMVGTDELRRDLAVGLLWGHH